MEWFGAMEFFPRNNFSWDPKGRNTDPTWEQLGLEAQFFSFFLTSTSGQSVSSHKLQDVPGSGAHKEVNLIYLMLN